MPVSLEKRPMSNIKFIHCRNVNGDGSVMSKGGLTIAYSTNDKNKVVGWAAAKCCMKDNFNKQIGRMKAAGRMLSAKYFQQCDEIDEKQFIHESQQGYHNAAF